MPSCPMPEVDGSEARISEGGKFISIQFRHIGQYLAEEALEKSRRAQPIVPVCIVPHAMMPPEFSQVLRNTPNGAFRFGRGNSSCLARFASRLKKLCCGHSAFRFVPPVALSVISLTRPRNTSAISGIRSRGRVQAARKGCSDRLCRGCNVRHLYGRTGSASEDAR